MFRNDATGRKQHVRVRLENNIHELLEERIRNPLSTADKFRNRLYKDCPPPFNSEKLYMSREVISLGGGAVNSLTNAVENPMISK